MRFYNVVDNSCVLPLFERGVTIYMVDFEQSDQRNMTRRVTHKDMLTPEKLASKNTFFYRKENEHE